MAKFFTHYWTNATWERERAAAGERFMHAASNQYKRRGVSRDDSVFVITLQDGRLRLGGRLIVSKLVDQEEAEAKLGGPLFQARDHVLADRSERFDPDRIVPEAVIEELRFVTRDGPQPPKRDRTGQLDRQTFRGVRELTPESAALLEDLLVPRPGEDWSRAEVRLAVGDYFSMLAAELRGEAYSKTERRRRLRERLQGRSRGSVEFKHQNTSSVLDSMGLPYIDGYKPRVNAQALLEEEVERFLESHPGFFEDALGGSPWREPDLQDLFADPPARTERAKLAKRLYLARRRDFADQDARNRELGRDGESFVARKERERLEAAGRSDLAQQVEIVSQTRGDGVGFDVLSFDLDGRKRYLEVKTTRAGKTTPFYVSANELEFSDDHPEQFVLYRVFDFGRYPRIVRYEGSLREHFDLEAVQYRVSPSWRKA